MKKNLVTLMFTFLLTGYCFSSNQNILNWKNQFISGDTTTISFPVNGNAACKANIESALTVKTGVVSASWDAASKTITVKYLTSALDKTDLYSWLALAGYDSHELRAKKAAYDALSADCQYTRDPETE